jgi:hypothetical protein
MAVVAPPFGEIGSLVRGNVRTHGQYNYEVQGRSLGDLRRQARELLLRDAWHWTRSYRHVETPEANASGLIFLAGHQPEVLHPGVWLKNFVLGTLARRHGAMAVNLLIDSDTPHSVALRVPGGSVAEPFARPVPFDRSHPAVPYEQRPIVDREQFATFGRRVANQMARLVPDPLITTYWPSVLERMRETDNLGACLAQSRHRLEADWGLETLEVPQSRVCETEPFYWFLAHLLAQLPRLWETYNQSVHDYRRTRSIRSHSHPVPDLGTDGQWLEAPFWIYSTDDPQRKRLFACCRGEHTVISDQKTLEISLPLSADGDATQAVERLAELPSQGVKIRSRALITTLWARLVLGDLFVHGIGGAKYDQVTDLLIDRFFGIRPPDFMVLSATLHLPIERQPVSIEQIRAIRQQLRNLQYHPEAYVEKTNNGSTGATERPDELIAAKTRWIETSAMPENARERWQTIRQINQALQPWVRARRQRLEQLRTQTAQALEAEEIFAWRQYGFCLYPETTLREFLRQLLPKSA